MNICVPKPNKFKILYESTISMTCLSSFI